MSLEQSTTPDAQAQKPAAEPPAFRLPVIRQGRVEKKHARSDENVDIRGGISKEFKEARPTMQEAIKTAIDDNREWLERELKTTLKKFPQADVSLDDIVPIFQQTLERRVKAHARLNQMNPEQIVMDEEQFQPMLQQAAFDFIMSLRQSGRRPDSWIQALVLAQNSHWLNPGEVKRLAKQYPDMNQSVITHAVLHYPKTPNAFIERYKTAIAHLSGKYPDVHQSVINCAALCNPKNADDFQTVDAFIERYKTTLAYLSKQYPNVHQSVINAAVLKHPKKSDAFITGVTTRFKDLQESYSTVYSDALLWYFAINQEPLQTMRRYQLYHALSLNHVPASEAPNPFDNAAFAEEEKLLKTAIQTLTAPEQEQIRRCLNGDEDITSIPLDIIEKLREAIFKK